jgi:hypothetical protein
MTKRISELPAAGSVADTDELELNQSGVSRRTTRGELIAGLASAAHQHDLGDIADAGALAALDSVGTAQIAAAAYASQSEAVAGADNAKVMTALRTAEAIAAQAAAPVHQHSLAEVSDAGALAALDTIRPTEIDPSAYATQIDAAEGVDGTRIMTAERTAEAIQAQAAPQIHQHTIAEITDVGALAALDIVGVGEIGPNAVTSSKILAASVTMDKLADQAVAASKLAVNAVTETKIASAAVTQAKIADGAVAQSKIAASAYASQAEAVAGTDNARLMTPLRTAEAIAVLAAAHPHTLADITDSGALAALDTVGTGEVDAAAYASQAEATAGTDAAKLMTPLRTAQAIAARAEPLHSPMLDEGDYSTTPFTVTDTGNERRYFLDAHNHIIEFPAGLATAAHGLFTAPPGNTLTLRRAADSGVSINGVASNAFSWIVPAGGTVEWQVRVTNTVELRGDTTAEQLLVGPLDANDQTIARPHFVEVTEGYADVGNKSGATSFDYAAGGWQKCVLVGNVTSVAVINSPAPGRVASLTLEIHQDGTGNRSIVWGAGFRFPSGAGNGLSTAANAIDIFTLTTRDGGSTWYVFEGGKAFTA